MTSHEYKDMMFSPENFAHLKIPLEDILSATNNFDEKSVMPGGGIGKFYKGQILWSGELIDFRAQRLKKDLEDREQQFWNEISMLSTLKHKNLVSLVGFCDENDEKIFIYKHETRLELGDYLSDSTRLTWVRRLEISVALANVLSYIYYDELRDFSVIHRKISCGSVLLNDNWEPKLYGFERSIKIKASERHHSFHKSDMKSFGIILMQLSSILNPEQLKQRDLQSFNMFADIACECLDEEPSRRPNIDDIVPRLEKALELQLKLQNHLMLHDNNSIVEGSSSSIQKEFQHLKIKLEAIKSATNKFDEAHCIGKGGFGKVYKGELVHSKGRSIVALKRLDRVGKHEGLLGLGREEHL